MKKNKMKTYEEEISFKKKQRTLGPISMKDASTSFKVDEKKLAKEMMDACSKSNNQQGSSGPASTTTTASVDFKRMEVKEKNWARVLPGKITEVEFLPAKEVRMLVTGNNFGNVGFWNIDSNDDNGIYVYSPHPALISGISIHPSSLSKIITSCYDGYIRLMDVATESFGLAYHCENPIFSIYRPYCDSNTLYFGEGHGDLSILDIRSSTPVMSWSLHYKLINTIHINPQNTNLMLTSSNDNTACMWDLRMLDQSNPKSLKEVRHRKKVNSAYFSPSGSLFASTSMDDNIGLLSGTNYDIEYKIHHYNYTSRFLSSIRGIWGWDDSCIMVSNRKIKGVDIISIADRQLSYSLGSCYANAIPCRLDAHPMMPGVLAGSTAGGQVYVWDI